MASYLDTKMFTEYELASICYDCGFYSYELIEGLCPYCYGGALEREEYDEEDDYDEDDP
ncbi:hypothetical protein [Aliterella atlantica]|uniref:hypothetical protein n=1 Tax=Aliterella atlantica TaxID=1827278 RepID=UPI001364DA80|nr:hypothetical protein [Aliterella atlantica]